MRVDVSGKVFSIPRQCACCGRGADAELPASATRTTGVKVVRSRTHTWMFPFCSGCVAHVKQWDGAGAIRSAVAGGGACLCVLAFIVTNFWVACVVAAGCVVVAVVLGVRARSQAVASCSPECACAEQAVRFLGWDGSLNSFEFAQPTYGAAFLVANKSKLVNLTGEGRSALEAEAAKLRAESQKRHEERLQSIRKEHEQRLEQIAAERDERLAQIQRGRSSVPGLSAPPSADGDHDQAAFMRWVSAMEAARGPAGRRAALESGLRAIAQPEMREKLTLEASRIEVQAALDKADGLKTPAAKLRTLRAALDVVRGDDVPDELQTQQIQWLEDAIAELERER